MTKVQKQIGNQALKNLSITLTLLVIFIIGGSFDWTRTGFAEDSGAKTSVEIPKDDKAAANKIGSAICEIEMTKYGDAEFAKYTTFMEDNFRNKSSTNSLMDLAMQRYDQFKTMINLKYNELVGVQLDVASDAGATNSSQAIGLVRCSALANKYIADAGNMLKLRATSTSNLKKASLFVEKYQQINSKLRALNLDVMRMVVNISSFEQKLPCYLKTCA